MNPGTENNQAVGVRTLLLRFRVAGPACYLSHQETLTFWQRFLVRCGLPLIYRGGFNPRPRLSLPLPRTVGLQTEDDLLAAEVQATAETRDPAALAQAMNRQLPDGIRVTQAAVEEGRTRVQPASAVYRWTRHPESPAARWLSSYQRCRQQCDAGEPIRLSRRLPKGPEKTIDLSEYVLDLEGGEDYLQVRCAVTPAGTVRMEEFMNWFGLEAADLAEPVRRVAIEWKMN